MKINIALLCCFFMLLSFTACKENTSKDKSTTQSTKKKSSKTTPNKTIKVGETTLSTYEHPENLYSVLLPENWKKEYFDKTQTVVLKPKEGEQLHIVYQVGSTTLDEHTKKMEVQKIDVKEMAKAYTSQAIGKSLGFKLIENRKFLNVHKDQPGHFVFDTNMENDAYRRHTALKTDGETKAVFFHLDCRPEAHKELKPLMEEMVNSFEFN